MNKPLFILSALSLLLLAACVPKTIPLHPNGVESNLATDLQESLNDKTNSMSTLNPSKDEVVSDLTEETEETESKTDDLQSPIETEDDSIGQEDKVIPDFPLDMDTPKTDSKNE